MPVHMTNLFFYRSPEQVTARLDKLVAQTKDIQRPYMTGERAADVLLVRFPSLPYWRVLRTGRN